MTTGTKLPDSPLASLPKKDLGMSAVSPSIQKSPRLVDMRTSPGGDYQHYHHHQRHSLVVNSTPSTPNLSRHLVGFDPLLADDRENKSSNRGYGTEGGVLKVPLSIGGMIPPPPPLTANSSKKHHRNVQTFCTSELRAIAQELGREHKPSIGETTSRVRQTKESKHHPKEQKPQQHKPPNLPLQLLPKPQQQKPQEKKPQQQQQKTEQDTPSQKKPGLKLPWQRHRRTKSYEKDQMPPLPPALTKTFTPPRHRSTRSQIIPSSPMIDDLRSLSIPNLQGPCVAKPNPTSFLTGQTEEVMLSSELDPSPHQIEIPPLGEFVVSSRLCRFAEDFRAVDANFDPARTLVNVSRLSLKRFVLNTNGVRMPGVPAGLVDHHKPIVQSLLSCGEDVELKGFFVSDKDAPTADDRREAAVFESQRQFTVVYRGTTMEQQQAKLPKATRGITLDARDSTSPEAASSNKFQIYSCFGERKEGAIDPQVFAVLDRLTEQSPFCDVVFTGHSFGGALATLAAFRYAHARPMIRVSCLVFGSPKVGERGFRYAVNCLPNLKVMRVELGNDPKCAQPSVDGSFHVGHSLLLQNPSPSAAMSISSSSKPIVSAYKFDEHRSPRTVSTLFSHAGAWKKDRDIKAYVHALEGISGLKLPWVRDFVGEDFGAGVLGKDNEARNMV